MIKRNAEKTLIELAKGYPIVAITGPRQSGKTTLVKKVFSKKPYISLEDPDKLELIQNDPRGVLSRYPEGLIIDEAQNAPKLFSYLQTIVDEKQKNGFFILTGSRQFDLTAGITQSLAGRVAFIHLLPFAIDELKIKKELSKILYHGLYPPLYRRAVKPEQWYGNYVLTYLERDLRKILNIKEINTFQRFLKMCAARTGQLVNFSSIANDCGINHNTVHSWISVLESSFIIFLLQPYYKNFGKRLVKTPKLYFYDPGLAAWLLNIRDAEHLFIHPLKGSLFESLIISEMMKHYYNAGERTHLYFWRDNIGDEIDIIIEKGNKCIPVELKSGSTLHSDFFQGLNKWSTITKMNQSSFLIYGGNDTIKQKNITILSWKNSREYLKLL